MLELLLKEFFVRLIEKNTMLTTFWTVRFSFPTSLLACSREPLLVSAVEGTTGSLSSPGWPQQYPAGAMCCWMIVAKPSQVHAIFRPSDSSSFANFRRIIANMEYRRDLPIRFKSSDYQILSPIPAYNVKCSLHVKSLFCHWNLLISWRSGCKLRKAHKRNCSPVIPRVTALTCLHIAYFIQSPVPTLISCYCSSWQYIHYTFTPPFDIEPSQHCLDGDMIQLVDLNEPEQVQIVVYCGGKPPQARNTVGYMLKVTEMDVQFWMERHWFRCPALYRNRFLSLEF